MNEPSAWHSIEIPLRVAIQRVLYHLSIKFNNIESENSLYSQAHKNRYRTVERATPHMSAATTPDSQDYDPAGCLLSLSAMSTLRLSPFLPASENDVLCRAGLTAGNGH